MPKNRTPEIQHLKTAALIPYARNARTHTEAQVAQIAASIREFGFTNPVLVKGDKTVIAGHGRLQAAHLLGLETVPCLVLDYLTDTQAKALAIADNKIPLNSGWDVDLLKLEMEELQEKGIEVALLGFSEADLATIFPVVPDFQPVSVDEQGKLDEKKKAMCPNCGHEFEPK
jgi:ParB-like chromosome segregation protein Spo0J